MHGQEVLLPETVETIRRDFRAVVSQTYLDVASCAPLSQAVRDSVARHLGDPEYGNDKQHAAAVVEHSRSLFAQLINAQPDDIALTKNVSEGLNIVANAMDWKAGDNMVVCPALEHPNNRYLWHNLAQRRGVELRLVPASGNEYPIEHMLAAIDAQTRLVTVSSVSYVPGFLTPLDRLAQLCRRNGALLLVDAAQSVGPMHTDVEAMGIDALAVGTQKGLLGLYGMGFLYVRPAWAQRLQPMGLARSGVDESATMGHGTVAEEIQLRGGARRFDMGNYNLVGATAAKESLALLTRFGTRAIQKHTVALALQLSRGLTELDLPVCKPVAEKNQTHVVCLGSLIPPPPADQFQWLHAFHGHLTHNRVRASWRDGVLRFSMHLYNNTADIHTVIGLARQFVAAHRR